MALVRDGLRLLGALVTDPVWRRSVRPLADEAQDRFVVRVVEADRALVLGDNVGQMSRELMLEPASETSTRLITRSRGAVDRLALGLMLKVFWHPLDSGMQRRQTVGHKRTVETA